jgi:hypothetical protein
LPFAVGSKEQWLAKKPQDLSGSYGVAVSLNLIYIPPGCAKEIERMCAFAAAPSYARRCGRPMRSVA